MKRPVPVTYRLQRRKVAEVATAAPVKHVKRGVHRRQQRIEELLMDNDKPLDEDLAEVEREGQMLVDRNIKARKELDDSNTALNDYEAKVATGAERALNFVRQYRNPTQPNPEAPLAGDVAMQPLPEEPPVFTTVTDTDLNPGNTSGGAVDAPIAEEFSTEFVEGDPAIAAGTTEGE